MSALAIESAALFSRRSLLAGDPGNLFFARPSITRAWSKSKIRGARER